MTLDAFWRLLPLIGLLVGLLILLGGVLTLGRAQTKPEPIPRPLREQVETYPRSAWFVAALAELEEEDRQKAQALRLVEDEKAGNAPEVEIEQSSAPLQTEGVEAIKQTAQDLAANLFAGSVRKS